MVKKSTRIKEDQFLNELKNKFESCKEKGTISITFKKDFSDLVSKKNKQRIKGMKNKLLNQEISTNNDNKYPMICRYKLTKNDKKSVSIKNDRVQKFVNSINNLSYLYIFKNKDNIIQKRIKKPTQKDPNSKTTLKKKARINLFKTKRAQKKKLNKEKNDDKMSKYNLAKNIK